jgi:hypothetical protein
LLVGFREIVFRSSAKMNARRQTLTIGVTKQERKDSLQAERKNSFRNYQLKNRTTSTNLFPHPEEDYDSDNAALMNLCACISFLSCFYLFTSVLQVRHLCARSSAIFQNVNEQTMKIGARVAELSDRLELCNENDDRRNESMICKCSSTLFNFLAFFACHAQPSQRQSSIRTHFKSATFASNTLVQLYSVTHASTHPLMWIFVDMYAFFLISNLFTVAAAILPPNYNQLVVHASKNIKFLLIYVSF